MNRLRRVLFSLCMTAVFSAPLYAQNPAADLRIVDGIILEGAPELSRDLLKLTNPRIVCVAHVPNAMKAFEENGIVTLDGEEKIIYEGTI